MTKHESIITTPFTNSAIRRHWDLQAEVWFFSVTDIIQTLTQTKRPRKYWNDLKTKLKDEGSELSEKIGQLKMQADDGKQRLTDVADTETVLRLVQSIPSPNAEPLKLWLARVGYERLEETADPEIGINRALQTYLQKGYSENWINQRLKSIEVRKALTDEWTERGVKKGAEFAMLTDEITKAWAGLTTKEYKQLKDLKKENLRDNMSNLELVLNMLAETATTEISEQNHPDGFEESQQIAKQGGAVAGNARKEIEQKSGKKIVSPINAKKLLTRTEPLKIKSK